MGLKAAEWTPGDRIAVWHKKPLKEDWTTQDWLDCTKFYASYWQVSLAEGFKVALEDPKKEPWWPRIREARLLATVEKMG